MIVLAVVSNSCVRETGPLYPHAYRRFYSVRVPGPVAMVTASERASADASSASTSSDPQEGTLKRATTGRYRQIHFPLLILPPQHYYPRIRG